MSPIKGPVDLLIISGRLRRLRLFGRTLLGAWRLRLPELFVSRMLTTITTGHRALLRPCINQGIVAGPRLFDLRLGQMFLRCGATRPPPSSVIHAESDTVIFACVLIQIGLQKTHRTLDVAPEGPRLSKGPEKCALEKP